MNKDLDIDTFQDLENSGSNPGNILDLSCKSYHAIPHEVFNTQDLKSLIMQENSLNSLPKEIVKCTELEELDFYQNEIDYITDKLGSLSKLVRLNLNFNKIKKVPSSITKLIKLRFLYLNNNSIEFLPENIGDLKDLRILNLSNNLLSCLPDSFIKLGKLKELQLHKNNFFNFPDQILALSGLTSLTIDVPLHNEIGLCKSLIYAHVPNAGLKVLPESIKELINLEFLSMENNFLKNIDSVINLSKLAYLYIQGNPIEVFPENINSLPSLKSISLNEQIFIPEKLSKIKTLENIYIFPNDSDFQASNVTRPSDKLLEKLKKSEFLMPNVKINQNIFNNI